MADGTALMALYHLLMFAMLVVLVRWAGGYILNSKHKAFAWIPSIIVAALIYVGQTLFGILLMGIGASLFG